MFAPSFLSAASQSRRVGWRNSISRVSAPPNVLLVAEANGEVCAFAHAAPGGESTAGAEIRAFFAHPDVWGEGVAAILMRDLCGVLREGGYREARLWTPREAHRARAFYEKVGFTSMGHSRLERVADWASDAHAELPEVEYGKQL